MKKLYAPQGLEFNWKASFQKIAINLKENRVLQAVVFSLSAVLLLVSSFAFLTSLLGALITSFIILIVLDRVFGLNINPNPFFQGAKY